MRWLSDLRGTLRTSFGIGRATVSTASLTAARTVTLPDRSIAIGDVWEFMPVGMPFPIQTHITGVPVPPTDNPNYRYIKLTASDSYNTGVLTSESVSGSAPLVQATAVINDAGSPMNGQTVRLINTEERVLRAGNSGAVLADALQNITASLGSAANGWGAVSSSLQASGAFSKTTSRANFSGSGASGVSSNDLAFDASLVARTANETRVKSIGADYFMRIY
ncbi:hypothetical protein P9K38_09965 [Pseudomonas sp. 905_Psudmo1]|nr:hypothetical protein [Pseudomonas sp. 905_Psudmo1]WFS20635.1 hypothetical protein P9K38_09965 [Pseudomonas sp. 905_Psudmo1]